MKPRQHGRRALLNKPGHHSTGAIVAEIEDTDTWEVGKNGDGKTIAHGWNAAPRVVFQISNCDRSLSFDVDLEERDAYLNSLHKVDTMIDALEKFRTGVVQERGRYVRRARNLLH